MKLYKQPDIREQIEEIIAVKNFSITDLKTVVFNFFESLEESFRSKIVALICDEVCTEIDFESDCDQFLNCLKEAFNAEEPCREMLTAIAQIIADCSDNEDFCDKQIYIVIKNFYGEIEDDVKEYDSWEDAEKDIDEWYTSCCDDLYIAENLMFPILCSVQGREYDYTVNFCTVIEFNAIGIEEGREYWEEENCDFDDCD